MKTVLCIGGFDPAGRAGILADAHAVHSCGARAVCVVTALTIQSSRQLRGYETVPVEAIARQLELLLEDEPIVAVKVGQLASADVAALVAALPVRLPLVLDTPLVSSTGGALFPQDAVAAAYQPLLRRAALVTPNAVEVFALAGVAPMENRAAAETTAESLPAEAVLLKGGHLAGDRIEDVLFRRGTGPIRYEGPRLPGRFRGTGCRLASAIAARLACGDALPEAVAHARVWLQGELEQRTD
jgi:hydroxymethylpyrimidine/phosphomethylpyrimidine kinase